ncbi:MAG: hypothetical protein AB7V04_04475 [Desulfomonilaceae bacterium]
MRQLSEMFQAMSMAVAFAEKGQPGTAMEIMELGRRRRSFKLQSEFRRLTGEFENLRCGFKCLKTLYLSSSRKFQNP